MYGLQAARGQGQNPTAERGGQLNGAAFEGHVPWLGSAVSI